ncbi:MAG: sugar ABC transporter ATP-binding protein [Spirochaetia bacterium]|nr:sugar ABC transporter ATP-binding protein [Spirochaetia bacterium]
MPEYILELEHITKLFPGVKALDDVHFNLKEGEIHGLMGENGAGKSTFIKTITGVYTPNEGEIRLYGEKVIFSNPLDAQKCGIAAIYQHVTCYPDLTVAENIFVGHEKIHKFSRKINWKEMHAQAQDLLDQLDANFSSKTRMGDLSVARQQIVEIAKALSMNAKIIIMDEPTAALSLHETGELYRITEQLRNDGASIIFISHRLEDIYRLADRVTIFRDASYIGTWPASELDQEKIVSHMVGRPLTKMFPKRDIHIGEEILKVENLSRTGYFRDVSFTLHKSEIVAITGLVGAGRTEVCESLYGITRADAGNIYIAGEKAVISDPVAALLHGIGFLPEDRQKQGLILEWEIGKNITLPVLELYSKYGMLNKNEEQEISNKLAKRLAVKAPNIFSCASTLSGGNQQKVVFAKLLARDLKIIILDEPTKGVDIGAKAAIYEIIGELAEQGYGIIMISSEMPEVLGLSDKIVVMKDGHVSALFTTAGTKQEEILHAAMVKNVYSSQGLGVDS